MESAMVNTVNKGELAPTCMSMFSKVESRASTLKPLLDQGYDHCLRLGITGESSPTVGTFEYEWRLMGVWFFFREHFPLDELLTHPQAKMRQTPVLIGQKFYSGMQGIGRSAQIGHLNLDKLKEFVSFFERQPVRWTQTKEERFDSIESCWI